MLFRVPRFGGSADPLTIFVSHSVVPIQQVFHRENIKIWTVLPGIFEDYSLNRTWWYFTSMKDYNRDLKHRLMKIGMKNLAQI